MSKFCIPSRHFTTKWLVSLTVLAGLLLPVSASAAATITFVQATSSVPQSPQTSVAVKYAAAQVVGDLNVVVVGWNDSTAKVNTVTDTKGNIYHLAVGPTVMSGALSQSIYYASGIAAAAAGGNTVTVAFSSAAAFPDIRILEYSGADTTNPVDIASGSSGSSATSTSAAVTTANATDLLFGANIVQTITTGPGANFTKRVLTSPDGDIAEDRMVTATGSYSATAALSSGKWIMQMVAFTTPRTVVVDTTPPSAPTTLNATAAGMTQINLSWSASTDNVGVTQYLIESCQGAGCSNFAQIGTATVTTFSNGSLTAGTSYSYRVRASDAAGNLSGYSPISTTSTQAPDTTPPSAPGNLQATAASQTQINLTWSASTDNVGVTGYFIESCQGVGCVNFAQIGSGTATSFSNIGLTPGATYSYRVRATDLANNLSQYSSVATMATQAPDTTPPSVPGNLMATATSTSQINLVWTASTDNVGVTQYLIESCQGTGCANFAQIGTTGGTTFSNTGLTAGTDYSYRVRASDLANNLSGYSTPATTTTQAPDTTPPSAPGTPQATASSTTQINLSWAASTDNVGVTQYLIESCQGASCANFAQVGTTAGTTFSNTGLTANTSYSYRVRAKDAAGNLSDYSGPATTLTQAGDTTPPSAPGTLNASATSGSQINLSWGAATDDVGVTQYLIERCQGVSCTSFAQVATATGLTFNNTGLTGNTSYSYRVRASDLANNLGPYSNTATATTQATVTGLVAAYTFDEGSGTTVNDLSGHGNTGTLTNTTWSTAGKFGGALVFNGTSSRVNINDSASLDLTTAMTLEAWVNPSTVNSGWRDVIYKGGSDNYLMEATTDHSSAPGAGATINGADLIIFGTSPLAAATWSHMAVTYDGANVRFYINGVQVSTSAKTGNILVTNTPLQIGGDNVWGQFFTGMIDEVRVYNVALTAAQIQADMGNPIAVDSTPPSAPGTLTANPVGGSQVNLSWGAATDNIGVSQYLVESCKGTGCSNFAQIGTTATTTFSNVGLTAGTSYSYRVRASDGAGNLGPYSNISSTTTLAPDTTPPSTPGTLVANATSGSQINLSWGAATDNVGVTQYLVESCQGTGCATFAQIGSTAGTTFSNTGLTAGTDYSYRVRASDAAGNLGGYSNIATTTTQPPDTISPSQPLNLTTTPVSGSQINLTWSASTDNVGVTGYLIERCQGAGCTSFSRLTTVPGTTFGDTGLVTNTSYTYHVKATDAAGNFSLYSDTSTAVTQATVAGLVAAYSFDEGTGSTIANDLSGNGNTGRLANTTWTSSGRFGNALVFNGTSSRVTINDAPSLELTTAMTLEAWVNPSNVSSAWRDVIYKGGNDNYFLEGTTDHGVPGGGATLGNNDTIAFATANLPVNTWSHLAVTYDGASLRLFVNGTQVWNQTAAGNILVSNSALQIGSDSGSGQYFAGMIDEVRVYNVALNQSQIMADMGTPVGGSTSSPGVNLNPVTVSFGNQATGSSSAPVPIVLTNSGAASLTISSISILGANAGDFTQTNNCPATLTVGKTCTINAIFAPTTTGSRLSSVSITDNAPGSPHAVPISGTGTGFQVTPRAVVVTSSQTQQFTATGTVTWSVDGVTGGTAATGTINSTGLYTPPAAAGSHVVTATATSQSASATVWVSNFAGMYTFHNDNLRSGLNKTETVLTHSDVNVTQFGKLFSYNLDGVSHASPLYVANVNIPGKGLHNVVYMVTEHDSVYAFDADGLSSTPLWQTTFLKSGVTTVPCGDTGECGDIITEIGITGTPVIDSATGTMYVVGKTKEGSSYVQRLHALDITSGTEKFGGPVVISGSVPGTGNGSSGGTLAFNPLHENQRPALALVNGVVYIGWSSHGDAPPWHGWLMGFNATTLARTEIFCATPNDNGGGIWQSGEAPSSDASGDVFFTTGNGAFNVNSGGSDYGDTVVKLTPSGTVADYFTPFDQANLSNSNFDLSSAGPVMLVDQTGNVPHLLIAAAKGGTIYVINRDNMGHFHANNDSQIVQSLPSALPHGSAEEGNYSAPVFFNNTVYFGAVNDSLKAYQFSGGLLTGTFSSQSSEIYPNRGGSFAVSANGTSNGILWAMQDNNPGNGVLHAYDATNLSTELYNSAQAGNRDTFGVATKFSIPLVANGKVFVVSQGSMTAFGLLP